LLRQPGDKPKIVSKTLYLHIGSPKTGSTALQYFFAHNQERLRHEGICYPRYKRNPSIHNHLYFSNLVVKAGAKRHREASARDRSLARRRIIAYMQKVINEAGSCHSILISCEEMFFARDPFILADIQVLFTSIRLVVYLRRQDQFIESYYLQYYKMGKIREPIHSHKFLKDDFWLDYHARLESWAAVFGHDCIIVRPFEKSQLRNADLFSDFLFNVFGIERCVDFERPKADRSNPRVDPDAYAIIAFLNSFNLPRKQIRGIIKRVLDLPMSPNDQNRQVSLLTPTECQEILNRFDQQNRKIAASYLRQSEGTLFKTPPPDPSTLREPHTGFSDERATRILLWIMIGLKERQRWRSRIRQLLARLFKRSGEKF
jgi:hypothetical protein